MFRRLLVVACLTAAPLAGVIGYHHLGEYRRLHATVRMEALERAQTIAHEYERLLTGAHYLLVSVSRRSAIRARDPDACRAALTDIVTELQSYAALAAYDVSGRPVCASFPVAPNENVAGRLFFQRAMTSGGFALGNALRNRTSGRLQLPAAVPFAGPEGQTAGVVMLLIDLDWIPRAVEPLAGASEPGILVADGDGTVIMQLPPPRESAGRSLLYPPLPPALNDMLGASKAGTVIGAGGDGVRRIWGYSPLGVTPKDLFVAAGIEEEVALARVNGAVIPSLAVSLAVLLLALAAGVLGGWFLLLPRARSLASALDPLPPLANREGPAIVSRLRRVTQSSSASGNTSSG